MAYRIAKSLDQMRSQVNFHAPSRSKASDGWIGDAKHAATTSDHNPWVKDGKTGIVTALDVTHDPAKGIDTWKLADHLRIKRDPRIKYVISNGRIFSSIVAPWTWRKYSGSNPHRSHIHVSVHSTKNHYDKETQWDLGLGAGATPPSPPAPDDPASRPVLRKGPPYTNNEHVKQVQRVLMIELVDGLFGDQTDREVRAFQRARNLLVDGVVGPQTWEQLDTVEQLPRPYNFDDPMELIGEPEPRPEDHASAPADPSVTGASGPVGVEPSTTGPTGAPPQQRREHDDEFDDDEPERDDYEPDKDVD